MRTFGKYISKFLLAFITTLIMLLIINIMVFFWVFKNIVVNDYGEASPLKLLAKAEENISEGLDKDLSNELRANDIWALFISSDGRCIWQQDAPATIPESFTAQDIAIFSKGYLNDYPVFIRTYDDGLLVLGYPKDSYVKLTGNYYSLELIRMIPIFILLCVLFDMLIIFMIYLMSKRRILKNTLPIIASIENLADGKAVDLQMKGDLASVAQSVNRAAEVLNKQEQARSNWIVGVSHDIRTPLAMIMGYAEKIQKSGQDEAIMKQAKIIHEQSLKIKDLLNDLNLVSQLEYDMQPLHITDVHMAKLVRSCIAKTINDDIDERYGFDIRITKNAEASLCQGDARLLERALSNLINNSIKHNPQGCKITVSLDVVHERLQLIVYDDGAGISDEKLQALKDIPHYMHSMDDRLDLQHGLGLLIVKQIVEAHQGTFTIENILPHGFKTSISIPSI